MSMYSAELLATHQSICKEGDDGREERCFEVTIDEHCQTIYDTGNHVSTSFTVAKPNSEKLSRSFTAVTSTTFVPSAILSLIGPPYLH
jgi:hypothetical protein